MAKKTYIGVSGKADEVKKIYVGVNGKARKVTKVYVGVNGIAKQVYQADHSYTTVVTPATCTTQGYTTYTCTFCGYTYKGDYTPIKGHNWNTSTYAWNGTTSCTATRICKVDSSHKETAAATITSKVTTAATCTTKGTTTYTATFSQSWAAAQTKTAQDVAIVSTAHSWKTPTYSGDGKSSYKATRVCNHNSAHTETATATITSKVTTPATCTTAGVRTYTADFSQSWATDKTTTESIAATGHAWSVSYSWSSDKSSCTATRQCGNNSSHNVTATGTVTSSVTKAATCSATGTRTHTATFSVSWATTQTTTSTIAINSSAHNWGTPTYSGDGISSYKATRKCTYNSNHTQTATASITSKVTTAATCTTAGNKQYTANFTETWATDKTTNQTIPKLGHNSDNNVDCTTDSVCTRCGIVLEEAWGHDWSEHPCVCRVCGETIHGADVYYEDVEPTCTESGQTGGYYCADCGEVWEEPTILPATGHGLMVSNGDYEAPTCTEAGQSATYSCSNGCGYTTGGGTIPALGHDWVSNDDYEEPTCEDDGHEESEYCGNCGETRGGDTIPATGHNWDEDPCVCAWCGYESHNWNGCVCDDCGAEDHTIVDGCYCDSCGEEFHDWYEDEAEESPTCSESGRTAHYSCHNCGAEHGGDYIEPTGNHRFDNWCDCQCTECGEWFHSYVDCVCENCGDVSHNYVDCVCTDCGEESHNFAYWDCTCEDCGYTNHTYEGGMCACGEYEPGYDPDACLMASTPILMADGTEKAISEVQAGDMIKSWDIENNEYIDVAVLGSYQTGVATKWSVYSFDNDKELTIYDQHNIYCKENNSIKKSTYWKPDQTAITLNGAETTYSDVTELVTEDEVTRHTLLTENNLYFANGILCGHHPRAKYKFVTKGLLTAEPEQLNQYKATNDIYQAMNGTENEEYRKEAAELLETIRKAKSRVKGRNNKFARAITKHKDLNKPDIMKLGEPMKLREKPEFVEEVDTLKQDIKTINKSIRKARKELNKIKEKYGVSTKTVYECWREAYNLDMEYLKNKK